MSLTDVTLCGKTLCSPVIAASGTFGFGGEYAGIVDMKKLGGISGKGLTLEGKYGNEGERLWETPAGLINSIGLQNPDPDCDLDYCPNVKREMELDLVLSTSLGFGGHNGCIAFKKAED